jgi:hypothetical protein
MSGEKNGYHAQAAGGLPRRKPGGRWPDGSGFSRLEPRRRFVAGVIAPGTGLTEAGYRNGFRSAPFDLCERKSPLVEERA